MTYAAPDGGRSSWSRQVTELLDGLTLEERAAQISAGLLPSVADVAPGPGPGFLFVPSTTPDAAARLRAYQESRTPGGIPALVLTFGPDLDRQVLPPLARVSTWDTRLAERMAAATARSLRADGIHAQLVPRGSATDAAGVVDGRWISEPVLTAAFHTARIRGAQGRDSGRTNAIGPENIAYAAAVGVWPDGHWHERMLRTRLLAGAEAAVRAGAAIVVPTPATNAGVPTHTDGWLLRDVLRREWGFTGVVLAHPGAVDALAHPHRIADDLDQAVALALEAGVDVISTAAAAQRIADLVRSGAVSSWLVDDAVAAVLTLKLRLGLVGRTATTARARTESARTEGPDADRPSISTLTRLALPRSMVLLSDPAGLLPLVAPPALDVVPGVGSAADVAGLARALRRAYPHSIVRAATGPADAARVRPVGTGPADVLVVVTVRPEDAIRVAEEAVGSGRGCVVLVTSDHVAGLDALAATTATVLICWRALGDHADIVAAVLAGRAEPGGRLPIALPPTSGAVPSRPTFPVGHGSGYGRFHYSRLVISPSVLDGGDVVRVQCAVTNVASRPGREVVQVHLADPTGRSVVTPGPELVAFSGVDVAPGQTVPVTLMIPVARLAVWNRSMAHIVEPGTIDVLVGGSAADIRLRGTIRIAASRR